MTIRHHPEAILFDLDRTLVDVQSFTDYEAALADVEELIGAWTDPPTPPTGWDGPTRRCMGILVALSGDVRWQQVSDTIERHERRAVTAARPMPGLADALAFAGGVEAAVVTLLPPTVARLVLDHNQVDVPVLVARQSDLAPKPAPDQVRAATDALGVDRDRVVMIGDSTWDAQAALAAGCLFVGVTNGGPSEFAAPTPVAVDLVGAVRLAMEL